MDVYNTGNCSNYYFVPMLSFINSPLTIGALQLPNRLIQGPLAGFSCAPFRQLFSLYTEPAYCVSEMISAHDVIHKHAIDSRYLYRAADEKKLCYQIAGTDPETMAAAAEKLQTLGADLIDINCGCPKTKIRKKGAGSALLDSPDQMISIIKAVRAVLHCPLTVKIRLQGNDNDVKLAARIAQAGADALIVHGRRWVDDYDVACDYRQIAAIKQAIAIPVIVNGDINNLETLALAYEHSQGDAFMISRAATGKPWFYKELLTAEKIPVNMDRRITIFMRHLQGLSTLESEYQAVLQSKSLARYYFKEQLKDDLLHAFYTLENLDAIHNFLNISLRVM